MLSKSSVIQCIEAFSRKQHVCLLEIVNGEKTYFNSAGFKCHPVPVALDDNFFSLLGCLNYDYNETANVYFAESLEISELF